MGWAVGLVVRFVYMYVILVLVCPRVSRVGVFLPAPPGVFLPGSTRLSRCLFPVVFVFEKHR